MTTFADLDLISPLKQVLEAVNYHQPTPIQAQAIPPLLLGRDVLGCAQTGTGKTAAFALPVLQHLANAAPRTGKPRIRALVLTPTRELAAQIGESFATYGRHLRAKHLVIFGGVNERPQIDALRRGIDILVATPGRLLDLANRGFIDFNHVEFFVLDEADRMLDMGFVHDVKRVISSLPIERQNLLFSATMPASIISLANTFLRDPVEVRVTPQVTTVESIEQTVMFVDRANKRQLLVSLLEQQNVDRAIVFTRTKHGANRLAQQLDRAKVSASAIHGNKSQAARTRALDGFRKGEVKVLIATDIASRGIDIDDVGHVFNYDLPNIPESYVHRIGRTARAGRSGVAISFCDETEGEFLRTIERTIGFEIRVVEDQPFHSPSAVPSPGLSPSGGKRNTSGRRGASIEQARRRPPRPNRGGRAKPQASKPQVSKPQASKPQAEGGRRRPVIAKATTGETAKPRRRRRRPRS